MSLASYLIPTVIVGYLAWQWRPLLRARRQRGRTVAGLERLFPGHVPDKAAVYFWSRHCVMCHGMTPVIRRLGEERGDVACVDAEQEIELARSLGVMATPSLVLIRRGRIARVVVGAQSEPRIRRLLDETFPETADTGV
ncbi:thioredoxin family protein [Acidihalobacter prosperus]|uniref:Thiol reductase thioredoxin n=1 Tax=Acidihalobacter prosperus TaxID=160660 RepID=A0A1A6C3N3_9GAMM|nr:thioredoxin family protein [Acidihalobacter prosperus]OBS09155.1 thiol reductase thioredoxin [Acidihalobacter prosperus]